MNRSTILGGAATLALLAACGGGGGGSSAPNNQPPAVNVTGTWRGPVVSSVTGTSTATLTLTQNGAALTGTYATSGGVGGNLTGTVSGYAANVTITPTLAGCTGSLGGTGTVSGTTMTFAYSGATSCGGPESGSGTLTKQ